MQRSHEYFKVSRSNLFKQLLCELWMLELESAFLQLRAVHLQVLPSQVLLQTSVKQLSCNSSWHRITPHNANLCDEWRQRRVDLRLLANLAPRMGVLLVDVIDDFRETHLREADRERSDVVARNVEDARNEVANLTLTCSTAVKSQLITFPYLESCKLFECPVRHARVFPSSTTLYN